MKEKYYKVLAKCGHVGKNKYILKWFYVKSISAKEAARVVRYKPRVKHNHKDAIRKVIEISKLDYWKGIKEMRCDDYFKIHNSSDQRLLNCINLEELYLENNKYEKQKNKKRKSKQRIQYEIRDKEMKKIIQGGNYD